MPKGCLNVACRNCEWHVVRNYKLECNFANRLGLKKGMEAFVDEEKEL